MPMVLSTEFIKLRRSNMLLYGIIGSILPALVKYLQYIGQSKESGWKWFLASKQDIMVFGMLITIVLISGFLFSMEYRYNTISYIFTSRVSRINIFLSKCICLFCIIALLQAVSALSYLLFGFLAIKAAIPGALLGEFLKVSVWYVFSFFLVSAIVVMCAILTKKFVITAVVVFGYLMLVFPFHLKGNPYILPLMTPSVIASKIFNTGNYILVTYFKGVSINSAAVIAFLVLAAAVCAVISIVSLKRSDAIR